MMSISQTVLISCTVSHFQTSYCLELHVLKKLKCFLLPGHSWQNVWWVDLTECTNFNKDNKVCSFQHMHDPPPTMQLQPLPSYLPYFSSGTIQMLGLKKQGLQQHESKESTRSTQYMSSFSRHKAYEQVRPHHHVFILLHLYKEHKKEKVTAPHLYKASISLL